MSSLARAATFSALDIETALPNVIIKIQGLAEDVQRIADVLETALPDVMDWQSFAPLRADNLIEVSGVAYKYSTTSSIELSKSD